MGSKLMHASILITHAFLWFVVFSFLFSLIFLVLPLFLFMIMIPPLLMILYCSQLPPFILSAMMGFTILPLNRFWLLMVVIPRLPTGLPVTQPLPLH